MTPNGNARETLQGRQDPGTKGQSKRRFDSGNDGPFCPWADGFYAQYPKELDFPDELRRTVNGQIRKLRGCLPYASAMHRKEELMQAAWLAWLEGKHQGWDRHTCIKSAKREVWRVAKRERDFYSRKISGLTNDGSDLEPSDTLRLRERALDIDLQLDNPEKKPGLSRLEPATLPGHSHHLPLEQVIDELGIADERHRRILELIGQGWTQTEVAYAFGVTAGAISNIIRKNAKKWFKNDAPKSVTYRGVVFDARQLQDTSNGSTPVQNNQRVHTPRRKSARTSNVRRVIAPARRKTARKRTD